MGPGAGRAWSATDWTRNKIKRVVGLFRPLSQTIPALVLRVQSSQGWTETTLWTRNAPADGAVGVEVEGHQVFWTCDIEDDQLSLYFASA